MIEVWREPAFSYNFLGCKRLSSVFPNELNSESSLKRREIGSTGIGRPIMSDITDLIPELMHFSTSPDFV